MHSHYIVFMLHQACRNGHVPDSLCIQTASQRIKEKSAFTTCNAYDSSQSWTSTNATSTQVLFSQWITNTSGAMFVDSVGLATCLDRVQYFLNPSRLDSLSPPYFATLGANHVVALSLDILAHFLEFCCTSCGSISWKPLSFPLTTLLLQARIMTIEYFFHKKLTKARSIPAFFHRNFMLERIGFFPCPASTDTTIQD